MTSAEHGKGEAIEHISDRQARADAYDRYLTTLRQKLATYQGSYLQAVQQEAEEIHCRWLLANQELFAAELSMR